MASPIPLSMETIAQWNRELEAEYPWCEAVLQHATISTKALLGLLVAPAVARAVPPATATAAADDTRALDLSFLSGLTDPDDTFIPSGSILIRDCMRDVFTRFDKFNVDRRMSSVLIGSPGVGKSLLFFLAALHLAQKKPVVFLRKTKAHASVSIFVICSANGSTTSDPSVDIIFTRTFHKGKPTGGLSRLQTFLQIHILRRTIWEYFTFVDGPHHSEEDDLLFGTFSFFCTSGGYPWRLIKDEGKGLRLIWILDGWSLDESTQALDLLPHRSNHSAGEVYALCGGNIRRILRAVVDFKSEQDDLDLDINHAMKRHEAAKIKSISFQTFERSVNVTDLPDRLITMFHHGDTPIDRMMKPIQYIDSAYVLSCFAKCIEVAAFAEGYETSVAIGDRTMQELFYERLIHTWIDTRVESDTAPFANVVGKVHWSTGSGLDGLKQFVGRNMYWIPSISNFTNFDAGLVNEQTMHLLQYTVKDWYSFKTNDFDTKFLPQVMSQFRDVEKVIIHFVTPTPKDEWDKPPESHTPQYSYTPAQAEDDASAHIALSFTVKQLLFHGRSDYDQACQAFFETVFL